MSNKKLQVLICPASLAFACSGLSSAANGYRLYVNERYGYEISYPSSFVAHGVSLSGDGQIFTSPQNDAELRVWAHTCLEEQQSTQNYVKSYRKREAEGELVVTYRHMSHGSAVVSGYKEKKVFYRKLLRTDSDWCTEFSFEYDKARKQNYDEVTSTIASSFKQ